MAALTVSEAPQSLLALSAARLARPAAEAWRRRAVIEVKLLVTVAADPLAA